MSLETCIRTNGGVEMFVEGSDASDVRLLIKGETLYLDPLDAVALATMLHKAANAVLGMRAEAARGARVKEGAERAAERARREFIKKHADTDPPR